MCNYHILKYMTKVHDENGNEKFILGEATPIRIGLVIIMIGLIVSGTWWAASVNSKLDSIISFNNTANMTFAEQKAKNTDTDKEINQLKLDNALIKVSLTDLQSKVNLPNNAKN